VAAVVTIGTVAIAADLGAAAAGVAATAAGTAAAVMAARGVRRVAATAVAEVDAVVVAADTAAVAVTAVEADDRGQLFASRLEGKLDKATSPENKQARGSRERRACLLLSAAQMKKVANAAFFHFTTDAAY
jgi:hypothetical protein